MEHGQGFTLDRYLRERGPLEPNRVVRIAVDLAGQIAQSPGAQAVYPGRILLQRDGTARLLPPQAEDLALPSMLEFPAYASPEEIRGAAPDVRSTLYSLGCAMFELMTGKAPYSGKDAREILRAHLEVEVPEVRDLVPGVPPGLASTVRELLEKDPELRIQSVEELTRRLRQIVLGGGGASVAPRPQAAPARAAPSPGGARPAARPAGAPIPPAGRRPASQGAPGRPAARPGAPAERSERRAGRLSGGSAARAGARPGVGRGRRDQDDTRRGDRGLGSTRKGARRGGGGGGLDALESDAIEEEAERRVIPKRSGYPFSIGGGVLGLLIGIVIIFSKSRQAAQAPALDQQVEVEATAAHLAGRKKLFQEELATKQKAVEKSIADLNTIPDDRKRDFIIERLRNDCTNPRAHLLAQTLAQLGPPAGSPAAAGVEREDADLTKQLQEIVAEADRLHAAGKIGPAYDRIYNDNPIYNQVTKAQQKTVDDKMEAWAKELNDRWERDKAEIDSLSSQGNGEKAIEVARAALEYGDGAVREAAQKLITSIQAQLDFQDSSGTKEPEDDTGNDVDDLEKELEKSDGGDRPAPPPDGPSGGGSDEEL